ncbi:hypothetical protein [Flexivirga caeni]|uniref:Uncharacterized protein n=1 Tax=Flexivirga caeni TaxID=2294115 RepID=A0A3M9M9X7_9MICO|nr:hypothetical protein [Flexivirga caeni]RNI21663.1 hypothetical protein EFY87_10965 [Flexivirga caeni]
MVNTSFALSSTTRRRLSLVIGAYTVVVFATIVALGVLSATASDHAPRDAWVHAIIVAVFAILLPMRLRAASRGSLAGLRAIGIISGVLFMVNVVESTLSMFPVWMRTEMIVIALLMLVSIGLVVRERL